jgi:hypothetical protein
LYRWNDINLKNLFMGFNKKFINKELILSNLGSESDLFLLLSADAFIFGDSLSTFAYELYTNGAEYEEMVREIKKQVEYENN